MADSKGSRHRVAPGHPVPSMHRQIANPEAASLYTALRCFGVSVTVSAGRIYMSGDPDRGTPPSALIARAREHEQGLIALLDGTPAPNNQAGGLDTAPPSGQSVDRLSFLDYLAAREIQDSPVGDFIADTRQNPPPDAYSFSELEAWLKKRGADPLALQVAKTVFRQFERHVQRKNG